MKGSNYRGENYSKCMTEIQLSGVDCNLKTLKLTKLREKLQ